MKTILMMQLIPTSHSEQSSGLRISQRVGSPAGKDRRVLGKSFLNRERAKTILFLMSVVVQVAPYRDVILQPTYLGFGDASDSARN
jgi:hypothetical protein